MDFRTLCARGERDRRRGAAAVRQAMQPPIVLSATYDFDALEGVDAYYEEGRGYLYGRYTNPTVHDAESLLARLEEAEAACLFGSGMAAISTSILALAGAGDTIAAQDALYGGTAVILREFAPRVGIEVRTFTLPELAELEPSQLDGCKLLYVETPVNPTLRIVDLERTAGVARAAGVPVLVDGTFGTPALQRPLALGCSLSLHSCTKYLGGHSDLVGGAAAGDVELIGRVADLRRELGTVADPMSSFLLHRGMRTLAVRMEVHCRNAEVVANALVGHAAVERVYWPGLPGDEHHALAARQMSGFGGMVAFDVRGGAEAARRVHDRVRMFARSGSLGSVESLISVPATMSHRSMPRAQRERAGVGDGTVRLSVGLEAPQDLVDDLMQALG